MKTSNDGHEVDLYRETPVRLLGYANEVGESFRSLIPVNLVRLSYLVAGVYCVADTCDKTYKEWQSSHLKSSFSRLAIIAGDTLSWQLLASVLIPGLTINRICYFTLQYLGKRTAMSLTRRKWTSTAIGLASIPVIVKPIDRSVDFAMDSTVRKMYQAPGHK